MSEQIIEPTPTPTPAPDPALADPPAPTPAPTPADPAPTPAKTIAAGKETPVADPAKPYWPEDWRQKVAEHVGAGDKKAVDREIKRLQRFTDPNGIYAMARELESKLGRGGLVKVPGADAKPEEVAEFHKALGVPEKPEGYLKDVKLDNGAVLGDNDKPVAASFAEAMHSVGAPPAAVNAALNWYFKSQEAQAEALDVADDEFRTESERALKEEFGNAYKRYTTSIQSLFASAPGGMDANAEGSLFARLMGGRMADGRIIGNDPDMVRFLVSLAREVNPAATVTESAGATGKGLEDEIREIEKFMRKSRREYFKDEHMQARYQELLGARAKIQARA
jgi:hypothetical protein